MLQIDTNKIVMERVSRGLNMSELATKANISRKTLYNIENNIGGYRLDTIGKIATALGKRIEDFKVSEISQ